MFLRIIFAAWFCLYNNEASALCFVLYVKAQLQFIEGIQQQLRKEKAEHLALEAHVRDEVTKEFSELISQMQEDYRSEITGFRVQLCEIITNYRSCFMMTLTAFCVFF